MEFDSINTYLINRHYSVYKDKRGMNSTVRWFIMEERSNTYK